MVGLTEIAQFLGSFALLLSLALAYGSIQRRLPGRATGEVVLGALFGVVAIVQMNMPVSPMEGFIIDMRAVPVALAGAYLGLRGLTVCIVIAAGYRLGLGGVGAPAGVMGMVIAGGAGMIWSALTVNSLRTLRTILGLGLAMSAHLFGALLLPIDLAIWFVTTAAPVMVLLNLVFVPPISMALERETRIIREGERLRRLAGIEDGDGVMPVEALGWALAQGAACGTLDRSVGVIRVRLRYIGLMSRLWGPGALSSLQKTMIDRITPVVPVTGLFARHCADEFLVIVNAEDDLVVAGLSDAIRRAVSREPARVPGMAPVTIAADIHATFHEELPLLGELMRPTHAVRSAAKPTVPPVVDANRPDEGRKRIARRGSHQDRMFDTFDRLRELQTGIA